MKLNRREEIILSEVINGIIQRLPKGGNKGYIKTLESIYNKIDQDQTKRIMEANKIKLNK